MRPPPQQHRQDIPAAPPCEDGYRLWLRYELIGDAALRRAWAAALPALDAPGSSPTLAAARAELRAGLRGLLGAEIPDFAGAARGPALLLGTPASHLRIAALPLAGALRRAGGEGYVLRSIRAGRRHVIVIAANRDIGALYGAFALLRALQLGRAPAELDTVSAPRISRRLLNHWDGPDRLVERGQAGQSLWDWFQLPGVVTPRYRDYARANASLGINGAVLNNVNADALMLTAPWLAKAAALADVFRPYGIRVYLSARFSAPRELGGLRTADPRAPAVIRWWRAKADEIYRLMPDFGGFLVKANSEGQPGPQDYRRTHADGANLLADALAPHGGVVFWRAFVYDRRTPADRVKQAYGEFQPLDGQFRPNVFVQIKNGPLDFQPREPFHPLFGAMPRTPLALELMIAQEYLGGAVHLAYLAPLFKECLGADTHAAGPGSTVARVIDGSLGGRALTAIAGVANTGSDRNWCGHPLAAANWHAFGRLAWDHRRGARALATEWVRLTFSSHPRVVRTITAMLLASREIQVNYTMPLGLHHIMATGHHHGPGPWVDNLRPDWNPVYYHRADQNGLGFDRTANGSNAVAQYAPELARRWGDPAACPENLLLWFHHVPWGRRLRSGRTLWDELCRHYQRGVDGVRRLQKSWASLAGLIDAERFTHVAALLRRQESEAREWRDACLLYFGQFSRRPLPAGVEPPEHSLAHHQNIQRRHVPGDPGDRG